MLFSGTWGKMIHEENLKQKISWHCPFKPKKVSKYGSVSVQLFIGDEWCQAHYCQNKE